AWGFRPPGPTSPSGEGSRRSPLPRAARRTDPGSRRAPVARALQPRVPPRVRRAAAPVPLEPAPRTRSRAFANDRPLGCGHLLHRGSAERRLLHDELRPDVRHDADAVPRRTPPPAHPRVRPDLRPHGLGAAPRYSTFREDRGEAPG